MLRFLLPLFRHQFKNMLGLSTRGHTNTNQLQVNIPDELKGVELQIIIIPANKDNTQIDFFSESELQRLSTRNLGSFINDNEDYSKW
jgi:hypothetical protein